MAGRLVIAIGVVVAIAGFVVGIPAAGQSLLEADALVGHCVNFLPLRTAFAPELTGAALLGQVRGTLLDAYDHQNYTYGSLVQTAYEEGVPIFCPAFVDSSAGFGLVKHQKERAKARIEATVTP